MTQNPKNHQLLPNKGLLLPNKWPFLAFFSCQKHVSKVALCQKYLAILIFRPLTFPSVSKIIDTKPKLTQELTRAFLHEKYPRARKKNKIDGNGGDRKLQALKK